MWLDREPPDRLAPSVAAAFSLVLIDVQPIPRGRFLAAVARACGISEQEADDVTARSLPAVLRRGLSWADAAIGQYELIAVDAVSVFLRDEVIRRPPPGYLDYLYPVLLRSTEFQLVDTTVELPATERANELREHFFGAPNFDTSIRLQLMRKKATIFAHLASQIGGSVLISGESTVVS